MVIGILFLLTSVLLFCALVKWCQKKKDDAIFYLVFAVLLLLSIRLLE